MSRVCALVVVLALALAVQSAAPHVPDPDFAKARALDRRLLDESKKDSQVLKNLTYLSDVIGPRLTGSANYNKAAQWAEQRMKDYGLSNVHLEPWTIPEGWERGKAVAKVVEPDTGRPITLASMGWYPGTKGKVTGDVVIIEAKTSNELAAYKGKLKDAVVLSGKPRKILPMEKLVGASSPLSRAFELPQGGGGKGFGKGSFAFAGEMRDFLRKEGVAALFQDSGKPLGLTVTTGGWLGKDRASASNRLPTLFVANNHYEMLYRLASRGGDAKTRIELDVENKFIPGPVKVFNVVGEIPGSEKPDEVVVLGAHLDSWDLGQGTLDNGTGSCCVLEAARLLAKCGVKPKRTIRFILFAGEEQGLYGSRHHVEKNKEAMAKVSACFVHDTGTGRVKGVGTGGRGMQRSILERELVTLKEVGLTNFDAPTGGGSDHQSFASAGVPAFMMVQEPAGYLFAHHTQADTVDAAKESDLVQGAQVLSVTAMRVANLKEMMPRSSTPRRKR